MFEESFISNTENRKEENCSNAGHYPRRMNTPFYNSPKEDSRNVMQPMWIKYTNDEGKKVRYCKLDRTDPPLK